MPPSEKQTRFDTEADCVKEAERERFKKSATSALSSDLCETVKLRRLHFCGECDESTPLLFRSQTVREYRRTDGDSMTEWHDTIIGHFHLIDDSDDEDVIASTNADPAEPQKAPETETPAEEKKLQEPQQKPTETQDEPGALVDDVEKRRPKNITRGDVAFTGATLRRPLGTAEEANIIAIVLGLAGSCALAHLYVTEPLSAMHRQRLAGNIIPVNLVLHSVTMLMLAAFQFSNPGFIEKSSEKPASYSLAMEVGETKVYRQWCTTCNIYRPLRAAHCKRCGRCVRIHDHHCPYLGNCAGHGNYRTYMMVITSTFLLNVFVVIISILRLASGPALVLVQVKELWMVYVLMGAHIAAIVSMSGHLMYFHFGLIAKGITTREFWIPKDTVGLFQQTSRAGNFCEFLSGSRTDGCEDYICTPIQLF